MVKPIIFDTDSVLAILDGRKTQTRRLVKPQPLFKTCRKFVFADETCPKKWEDSDNIVKTYQYQPGDILYVREPFSKIISNDGKCKYIYKATDEYPFGESGYIVKFHWHPSIQMPKEAARIWLKVKNVSIKKLQDMTEEDAEKEGSREVLTDGKIRTSALLNFYENMWNSRFKKSDLDQYGWEVNPYVFVVEFERCEKPENM
jgi:hypothetical protein